MSDNIFYDEPINRFDGEFKFLSNFYTVDIEYEGKLYKSSEHAYQAAKTFNDYERDLFCSNITAGEAKKLGRKISIRPDWDDVKTLVMYDILKIKFSNPKLKNMLLMTNGFYLEEGNYWNDIFWGVCNGIGENNLGKILMKIRDELLDKQ